MTVAIEPELLELFTDRVTIKPTVTATGTVTRDLWGREAETTPTRIVKAFIERETRVVQSTDGREVIASATIYLDDVDVGPLDHLFYDDGTEANIVSVDVPRDEDGPHHAEVAVA